MIKPLADRIVIKVIEDTEQTSGGIFIPDSAKEKPLTALKKNPKKVKLLLSVQAK